MAGEAVEIVREAAPAASLLDPLRRRILRALADPDSAAGVARTLGLPRQKVNYHVRRLEDEGLVTHVEDRPRGGMVERVVRASAPAYVISPELLGALAPTGERPADRFSADHLVASAARTIGAVAALRDSAREAGKRLATLSVQADVGFASPADQVAFAQELVEALAALVGRYHDDDAPVGRTFRLALGGHPAASPAPSTPAADALRSSGPAGPPGPDGTGG